MISRIEGRLKAKRQMSLLVELQGISYEVWIPKAVMQALDHSLQVGGPISLVTYHYYHVEPSRSVPILIGFTNEIEREFFEAFISVSGIGPRAAVKALKLPFSSVAQAIDAGDLAFLKTLPGIGEQRAKEVVAKLQGKVGKFALIQDHKPSAQPRVKDDIQQEALEVLLQLQYKRVEAEAMLKEALVRNPHVASAEELLNEVYKSKLLQGVK